MIKKMLDYPDLRKMIQSILFDGYSYPFKREAPLINLGVTFGFFKDQDGIVVISNRIFETQLYGLFLSEIAIGSTVHY